MKLRKCWTMKGGGRRGIPPLFVDKLMKLKEHQWILSNATLLEVSDLVSQGLSLYK